ncbi:hypothetical protein FKM82_017471 [Ascaphus truei]
MFSVLHRSAVQLSPPVMSLMTLPVTRDHLIEARGRCLKDCDFILKCSVAVFPPPSGRFHYSMVWGGAYMLAYSRSESPAVLWRRTGFW